MQNDMVKVMALRILRKISTIIQATPFYTIMVDETADVSNKEQVVVCIRWVDDNFEVHEDFIGLYQVDSTGAEKIYHVITDVFLRLNLTISKVRGQCYDGASAMSGAKSGVVARMQAAEPRAVFTHCYGHALNLACADTIKQCKLMRDALDTTYEITKHIKKSPRRDAIFNRLKEEMGSDSPGIRMLCPTRWTVRAEAFKSILDNFSVILELWDESLQVVKDTEMKARIQGVSAQMKKFEFFFGVSLGLLILRHTDNLSRTVQKEDMSAAEGQEVVSLTLTTLKSLRNDASFDLFWQRFCASAEEVDVDKPILPRRRKLPRRLVDGTAPTVHATVEEHYHVIYFEAVDLITSCVSNRFNQPGYKTYAKVQNILLKAATSQPYEEELRFIVSFYGSDINSFLLSTHLDIFSQNFEQATKVTFPDVVDFFRNCSAAQVSLMSEVSNLV